ncbi:winged helix DNA-binding protein [Arthrobacter jiangjiafuii]|uniref:Winged helix DNA-binding protein n=1 Tax=Arthrobacter jiangjiafuii TaxID=2817475 RepID=A0A975M7P3_9MICC|nr:winged helix DNA-binding protein [Arthrobacter jiangjiafuii]QWC11491.1 winged helix DNA-binding protein [Arthrobacter jiangjiafuii]
MRRRVWRSCRPGTGFRARARLVQERICAPFHLSATGFPTGTERFPAAYEAVDGALREAVEYSDALAGPPQFESLAGGMVSTVPDYRTFLAVPADDVVLPPALRQQMTEDQGAGRPRGVVVRAGNVGLVRRVRGGRRGLSRRGYWRPLHPAFPWRTTGHPRLLLGQPCRRPEEHIHLISLSDSAGRDQLLTTDADADAVDDQDAGQIGGAALNIQVDRGSRLQDGGWATINGGTVARPVKVLASSRQMPVLMFSSKYGSSSGSSRLDDGSPAGVWSPQSAGPGRAGRRRRRCVRSPCYRSPPRAIPPPLIPLRFVTIPPLRSGGIVTKRRDSPYRGDDEAEPHDPLGHGVAGEPSPQAGRRSPMAAARSGSRWPKNRICFVSMPAMLRIAPRSATEVVDQLQEKGLVERTPDPTDRRATQISLSDAGLTLLERIRSARRREADEYFSGLTAEACRELARILGQLAADGRKGRQR